MFKEAVINFFINGKQATQQLNQLKANFKTAANDIKNSMLIKVGTFGTALFGLGAVREVYNQTKELANFSQKFNLPVEEVSKFSNVLSQFGGSSEDTRNALGNIEQAITDFKTMGGGALKSVSSQIGISMYNMNGKIKNSIQIIGDLRQKFKGLNQDAQLKVAQELGLTDPASLRMLKASDAEYKKMTEQANKMSIVSKKNADTVLRVQALLSRIKQTLYSIGTTLLTYLEPVLNKVAEWFEKFNSLSEESKKKIVLLGVGFAALMPAISILTQIFNAIKLIKGAILLLNTVLLANPIMAIITAAIAGFVLLYKKCEWFRKLVDKTLGWLLDKIKKILGWVGKLFGDKEKLEIEANEKIEHELTPEELEEHKKAFNYMMYPSRERLKQEANNYNNTNNNYNNNVSKPINNTFNFTLSTNANISETENMLNKVIRQNTSGVAY